MMIKFTHKFFMAVFLTATVLATSCKKKDDVLESITIKRSGSINVTVLNDNVPATNHIVRITNISTGNEVDVLVTNDKGNVDFSKLNDGSYSITIEITEPNYAEVTQEVQVISGESISKTINLNEYLIDYEVQFRDLDGNLIVEEVEPGLEIGICFLTIEAYNKLIELGGNFTSEDILSSATAIKYFGTKGKISATLSVDEYLVVCIAKQADGELNLLPVYYHNFTVRRLDKDIFKVFELDTQI